MKSTFMNIVTASTKTKIVSAIVCVAIAGGAATGGSIIMHYENNDGTKTAENQNLKKHANETIEILKKDGSKIERSKEGIVTAIDANGKTVEVSDADKQSIAAVTVPEVSKDTIGDKKTQVAQQSETTVSKPTTPAKVAEAPAVAPVVIAAPVVAPAKQSGIDQDLTDAFCSRFKVLNYDGYNGTNKDCLHQTTLDIVGGKVTASNYSTYVKGLPSWNEYIVTMGGEPINKDCTLTIQNGICKTFTTSATNITDVWNEFGQSSESSIGGTFTDAVVYYDSATKKNIITLVGIGFGCSY